MPYEYDVFLSYRRHREWTVWVRNEFLPLFEHYLGEELGTDATVFFDEHAIETGTAWPLKLASALAKSKVLVCLWSNQYFSSNWCKTELSLMRARENACRYSTIDRPEGLIVPAVIHGDRYKYLPASEKLTAPFDLIEVVNPRMAPNSPLAEKLASRIAQWAPDVASAVGRAPDFDPEWSSLAEAAMTAVFQPQQSQNVVPSLGA
jgi:hypothetical protein